MRFIKILNSINNAKIKELRYITFNYCNIIFLFKDQYRYVSFYLNINPYNNLLYRNNLLYNKYIISYSTKYLKYINYINKSNKLNKSKRSHSMIISHKSTIRHRNRSLNLNLASPETYIRDHFDKSRQNKLITGNTLFIGSNELPMLLYNILIDIDKIYLVSNSISSFKFNRIDYFKSSLYDLYDEMINNDIIIYIKYKLGLIKKLKMIF